MRIRRHHGILLAALSVVMPGLTDPESGSDISRNAASIRHRAPVRDLWAEVAFDEEAGPARRLIYRDDFQDLANWENHSGTDVLCEDGVVRLGTSRDGIILKRDLPPDLMIEMKAQALIWREGTFGCGFRVLLRMTETIPASGDSLSKHDFYDLQFHPTPDVPAWGGYRHILVFKQFAGSGKNVADCILEKRWNEGKPGHWYDVRILMEGSTITAWLDGEEVVAVMDPQQEFSGGRFGLAGFRDGNHARFKNLKIWAISREGEQ